jgi:excisionase family DNA binding protein
LYEIPDALWEKLHPHLPVKVTEGGEAFYLESEVDAFLAAWLRRGHQGKEKPDLGAAVPKQDAPAPDYVSVKGAVRITGLSDSHLRRAIRAGELPASNMGSSKHPFWRIARKELDQWIEKKKGGAINVPPKSDLDDLIRRHLPGLRGRKESATR